jgi:GNAT superfamily N-acetyltransferase
VPASTVGSTRTLGLAIQTPLRARAVNPVSVRLATAADVDTLAVLFDRYRQFQGKASDQLAAHAFLRDRLDHGESMVFMAYDAADAVGFAQLYPSFSSVSLARVFILNDLFIDESARRRGAASALLHAIEVYAWSVGSVRVTLNVARGNTQAQALYASRGWSQDTEFFMFHRYSSSNADAAKREA